MVKKSEVIVDFFSFFLGFLWVGGVLLKMFSIYGDQDHSTVLMDVMRDKTTDAIEFE